MKTYKDQSISLLEATGLTMAEVGNCLGITRQAVANQINSGKDFFDKSRIETIFHVLSSTRTDRTNDVAKKLRDFAKEKLDIDLDDFIEIPPDSIIGRHHFESCEELWVFTNNPLEIEDNEFIQFMIDAVFTHTNPVLCAYFLYDESQANRLTKALELAQAEVPIGKKITADIHVVLTNAIACCPHLVLFDPGSWCANRKEQRDTKAWAMHRDHDKFVQLPERYVHQTIKFFNIAGIGMTRKREDFCPPECNTDGIYFKRYAGWLTGERIKYD